MFPATGKVSSAARAENCLGRADRGLAITGNAAMRGARASGEPLVVGFQGAVRAGVPRETPVNSSQSVPGRDHSDRLQELDL